MKEVYKKEEINISINRIISLINHYYKNSNDLDIQNLFKISLQDKCDKIIYELFLSYLTKSESVSPGSSIIFIDHLLSEKTLKDSNSRKLKKQNILELFCSFADKNTAELVKEAVLLSGLKGKIVVNQTNNSSQTDVIELTKGQLFEDLIPAFSLKNTKLIDPRVVVIDGFIESVSEIHHLLQFFSEKKESIVIFSRGFSEDVINTLKINYDRSTLVAIPIVVKFDLDGANLLNDIAIVCCTDVISSLKGQLISSIDHSSIRRINCINLTSKGIVIDNPSSFLSIENHISNIKLKIDESENNISVENLTKRLQRLGFIQVAIKLSNTCNNSKKMLMIDRCLRSIKMSSTYGIIDHKNKIYPYSSFECGKFYASKFMKVTEDLGSLVIE